MKILFVLEHFYPYIGGAEKLFYVLSKSLVKEGFEVTVVTTLFDKKLPAEEVHEGVKIVRVNCFNRFAFTFLSLPKILQHAKEATLIHTTTYNAALPAVIAGKLLKKPVFVTFHEVWGDLWRRLPFTSFWERNAFYFFEKMLLKLPFSKFIAVSEFTKNALLKKGISAAKIEMIYNGIDYTQFEKYSPNPPSVFTFTYFGRLGISKGLDLLIPAAAAFCQQFPDAKFKLIIPKYPVAFFQKIKVLIDTHNLAQYIEFHHNLPREILYQELLSSSCVVIPSYSEGFCFAAAETVALNLPIISSHQGALQETVSGQFVPMKAMTIAALTEALTAAYEGNWTRTPIRYFSLTDSVAAYKKMYQP
jgi:glycosyltransferase involved in cell wall biosynthesis